jgi:multidrug efflux pump
VLVGGMTIGTLFTLFIVPSLYVLIARTHDEGRTSEPEEDLDRSDSPAPALVPDYADV